MFFGGDYRHTGSNPVIPTNKNSMIKVNIKPLSVNDAWQGRRRKTKEYRQYEEDLMLILPNVKIELDKKKRYQIILRWGFSSSASDWDNPIKPTQDCIAKRYGFNDKLIHKGVVEKELVKKGKEYFEFNIIELT